MSVSVFELDRYRIRTENLIALVRHSLRAAHESKQHVQCDMCD
jgi:hypothetical protein